ncbi:MAG: hypothetical protein ABFR31_09065 [Thermodesulfobacteriota bacterium]
MKDNNDYQLYPTIAMLSGHAFGAYFTLAYAQKINQDAPLSLKGIKKIITMFEKNMAF